MNRLLLAVVTTCLAVALPAAAQDSPWTFKLGASWPSLDAETGRIAGTFDRLGTDSAPAVRFAVGYRLTLDLGVEATLGVSRLDLGLDRASGPSADAGRVWYTPATVMATYHLPLFGDLRPYAAAGVAVTGLPYWQEPDDRGPLGFEELSADVGFGPAAAVGLDWSEGGRWFLSLELGWFDAPVDIDLEDADGTRYDTVELDVDPVTVTLSFGWHLR